MDYLRKNKLIGWVVLALILMNAATLTMLWIGKADKKPRGGRLGGEDLLAKELNLSEEQVQKLENLREDHFLNMRQLRDRSHDSRNALHELWQKSDSKTEAQTYANRLGAIQAEIEMNTYDHFSQIREMLTNDQKIKFDKIIIDVLRRGDRRPEGPPPNGQDGQRGPRPRGDRPPPRTGR